MGQRSHNSLIAVALLATIIADAALAREEGNMRVTSTAFSNQSAIPALYTCEGKDISPALAWMDLPTDAKSLVLIVDDPAFHPPAG